MVLRGRWRRAIQRSHSSAITRTRPQQPFAVKYKDEYTFAPQQPTPSRLPSFRKSRINNPTLTPFTGMDIQVDPQPQLIPILRPDPKGKQPATPQVQQAPQAPQTLTPEQIAEQKRQELKGIEKDKAEKRYHRRLKRQERERHRLAIIQHWQAVVDKDRKSCLDWIAGADAMSSDVSLGKQIMSFWNATRPTTRQTEAREQVVRDLQQFFDETWPGHQLLVAPFGSSVTAINHSESDLDLVLLDPSRPLGVGTPLEHIINIGPQDVQYKDDLPEFYNVRKIAKNLQNYTATPGKPRYSNILAIVGANVPILKFEMEGGIAVDLNINNRFGLLNSNLIRAYADLRPKLFRPLCYAVKHWLKRRGLNDPSGQAGLPSLSSYSIVIMVIRYLQLNQELPLLQYDDLLEHVQVDKQIQYQSPKPRRRRAMDPRREPGQLVPRAETQAECYDVTFFDPRLRPRSIKEVKKHGWRCWINTKLYDADNLPPMDCWDEELREDLQSGGLNGWDVPESIGVGLHKTDLGGEEDLSTLGHHLKGFIKWLSELDKRNSIINIDVGLVCKVNTWEQRKCFQEAQAEIQKPESERNPHFNYGPLLLFDRNQPLEWESNRIITRDPFIRDRNTSKNIGKQIADGIEDELKRAVKLLSQSSSALFSDLCLPLAYTTALETPSYITPEDISKDDNEEVEIQNYTGHFKWPNDKSTRPNPGTTNRNSKSRINYLKNRKRGNQGRARGGGSGTTTGTDTGTATASSRPSTAGGK
ncbi:unnamed protein product [Sympodiomycopsis kandeliae]